MRPALVHFGTAEQIRLHRQTTLDRAYTTYPHRFTRRTSPTRPIRHQLSQLTSTSSGHLVDRDTKRVAVRARHPGRRG